MSKRFYSTLNTEPDMRQEMINTLDGSYPEITKKQRAVLRKMRRGTLNIDEDGDWTAGGKTYTWSDSAGDDLLPCPCTDAVTKEPDKDHHCPFCWGEGFIWDESFIDVYKVEIKSDVGNALIESLQAPGLINEPVVIFYTRSSVSVTQEDKVAELVLDTEGSPVKPYFRKKLYRIGRAIDLRADRGKLEYWKLDCWAEYRKFLNGLGGA
jgi:hypothetical protein